MTNVAFLPISSYDDNTGVYNGFPTVLGKDGVIRRLKVKLTEKRELSSKNPPMLSKPLSLKSNQLWALRVKLPTRRPKMLKKLCCLLATFIAAFSINAPTFATTYSAQTYTSANSFYFEDFAADYYLYRDDDGTSRMLVIEELTAVFPESDQNHGINRASFRLPTIMEPT